DYPTFVDIAKDSSQVNHAAAQYRSKDWGRGLWSGDFNGDHSVIYQGPKNDIGRIFLDVMSDVGNINAFPNYIRSGYEMADFDLDGNAIYQGPNNDRSKVLTWVTLQTPENVYKIANFIVREKIP